MKKTTVALISFMIPMLFITKAEAKTNYPTYTIDAKSSTFQNKMKNYSTYNSSTKHYYVLRSYLEQLQAKGGGTLVLKKGTYNISNTLYVPSNVTIKMKNGVVLNKTEKTGTSKMKAAKSMFQLIRPKYAEKKGAVGGYNGEKNISFIGEGTVKINMNYVKDGIAIIAGHNQNLKIQNIKFSNMYSGHFIELDASKNVTIEKNEFNNSKASSKKIKEAINLDTPDKLTEGWSQKWSKFDKTANNGVVIKNNKFYNLDAAIGTHNYSTGKLHNNVKIQNNIINKMRTHGIRVMNWSNAVIENNVIKNVSGDGNRGILASGASNPNIKKNKFENVGRAIQFIVWKNDAKASSYPTIYNKLSTTNINNLETNTIKNGVEGFIRFNTIYNNYKDKTRVYPIDVISIKTKPEVKYTSKTGAKAYKKNNKTSGYYKTYGAAKKIEVYSQGGGWYYQYTTDNKGKRVRAYLYSEEIKKEKPFMPTNLYVGSKTAKVYQKQDLKSKVLKTYNKGQKLGLEKVNANWYKGYVRINNVSTLVYVEAKNIQSTKPFVPKKKYVSKGGANAYEKMNKTSEVIWNYEMGEIVQLENIDKNWYFGYVQKNGKSIKVYLHEDNVQSETPIVEKQKYISRGGANAYQEMKENSKILKTYNMGDIVKIVNIDKNWYFGYITLNGEKTKVYFHEDNVQNTNPLL